eukprot:gene330-6744_t
MQKEVDNLCMNKKYEDALKTVLATPSKEAAEASFTLFAEGDPKSAKSLTVQEQDVLMKYLYKCMEKGESSKQLFKWMYC